MTASQYLTPGRFALIAHRGGALEAPENTVEAFKRANKLNDKYYFELDVHETKDGVIVVIHDETVDRTTDGHGSVAELNYSEIAKFDAGYRFSLDGGATFPFRGQNCRIPKLYDVLMQFPLSFVSIEHKKGPTFFGQKLAQIIDETKSQNRVCIAGEDHEVLKRASKLLPQVCSGFSAREMKFNYYLTLLHFPVFLNKTRGDVMQIPFSHNGRIIATPSFIGRAHSQGTFVHVWTVNDEETMRHLIEIGADGIITDAPTLLLRVAQDLKKI